MKWLLVAIKFMYLNIQAIIVWWNRSNSRNRSW